MNEIESLAAHAAEARPLMLSPMAITCNPLNPRKLFDQQDLMRFGIELKEHGVKQPLRVFPRREAFVLISGERRWRAATAVGIPLVPCLVEAEPADEAAFILDQLVENDGHKRLSPDERGDAYQHLIRINGWSAARLARALCISESEVSRTLTIRNGLDKSLHGHVQDGRLPYSLACEIARVRSAERQRQLAQEVIERGISRAELIQIIRAERSVTKRTKTKPIRVIRTFPTDAGFEPIKNQLESMLADVQRCIKNGIPVTFLSELWTSSASH
jgi:ParB family chromosome partitioning protein